MNGKVIILIFLFLLIPVGAETDVYKIDYPTDNEKTVSGGGFDSAQTLSSINILDIDTIQGVSFFQVYIVDSVWGGQTEQSNFTKVSLYAGSAKTDYIGSGILGYIKDGTDGYRVQLHIDGDLDWGAKSGQQYIFWTVKSGQPAIPPMSFKYHVAPGSHVENGYGIWCARPASDRAAAGGSVHTTKILYYFYNPVEYWYNETEGRIGLTIYRNSTYQSKWYVNASNTLWKNETSLQTNNETVYSYDLGNLTWDTHVTTDQDDIVELIIDFSPLVDVDIDGVGTIELNQSSYTEPELIQIDVELTTYDFTDHSYYIISEVSEDLDYWDNVAGIYNGTTKITTTTASRVLDVDTWLYDLPIWVRARLVDYNKLTGEYTTLDTTPAVLFNPPTPGSIKFGGTVIDADTNQVISSATVSVEGVTTTSDTTNAFGEFLIYLYPGVYTVTASKTGYQTYTSEELLMEYDNTWAQIYLTPIGYGNGTLYGNVNDVDTGYAIQDVHVIITNVTDSISAYTSSGGYYEATGLAQSSTYTIRALKTGYYTYNGSVTTEASGASHKSFNMVPTTATPTPTPTVLPTSTYPGGEGHEWTNDEIVTMLRVLVPGFFLLMLVFLLLAVMLGIGGNNGNGGQRGLGLDEIWKR